MGIIRTTAYPSRYYQQPDYRVFDPETGEEERLVHNEEPEEEYVQENDTFWISTDVGGGRGSDVKKQRELSQLLAEALGAKAVYDRIERIYRVGGWAVMGTHIRTEDFSIHEIGKVTAALESLKGIGYYPKEGISLHYLPEIYDAEALFKMILHFNNRKALVEKAFGVGEDGFSLILREQLECWMEIPDFDAASLEAGATLVRQLCIHTASIRNVRLNGKESENQKYQMRTWLLRLGFIGDEFAGPRKTLLANLDGDTAFRTESSKQQATYRRRAKKMRESVEA
ncbi:MAG: hypothetical protein LUD12_01670 [Lachnospiraceae bacterium]|nr:hypothetical protein [Lachnospiraceae bacterium]